MSDRIAIVWRSCPVRASSQAMDEINAMLISVTESRRKVSVSMLAAHAAGELRLTPDEVARCHEDIAACDVELAALKTGQDL